MNANEVNWEDVLGFNDDRKYSNKIITKDGEEEHKLNSSKVFISYSNQNGASSIECQSLSISDSSTNQNKAGVMLELNRETKSVVAFLNQNICVHYKAHQKPQGGTLLAQNPIEIFDFENLFKKLISPEGINFDPSVAIFKFGDKQEEIVKIESKAAKVLFVSIVKDAYSGFYPTL